MCLKSLPSLPLPTLSPAGASALPWRLKKCLFFFLFILKTIVQLKASSSFQPDCAPTFQPFVSLVGFGTFFYSNVFLNPWKQYVSQDINESMRCYCHEMNMMGCIHEALWVENPFALSLNPVRPCSLPGLSIVVSCRQWALSFQLLWEQLKYKWVVNVVNQNCQDRHKSNWKSHISKHKVTTIWKQLHCNFSVLLQHTVWSWKYTMIVLTVIRDFSCTTALS